MTKKLSLAVACAISLLAASTHAADSKGHPDSKDWPNLFKADLSDAQFPKDVWTLEGDTITASKDEVIWTTRDYENFVLDLEFKNGAAANSGVIVFCTDTKNWIPNSVEIQLADDHAGAMGKSTAHVAKRGDLRPAGGVEERGKEARRMEPLHGHVRREEDHHRIEWREGERVRHDALHECEEEPGRQRGSVVAQQADGVAPDER